MSRHTVIPSRVLIVISTLVVTLVLLLASSVHATPEAGDLTLIPPTAEYMVRSGDTLWAIAGEHTAEGRDVRDTIEAIKRLNHIDGSLIRPGQVLEIPLYGSS